MIARWTGRSHRIEYSYANHEEPTDVRMPSTKPALLDTILALLQEASSNTDSLSLLKTTLPRISQTLGYDYAAVVECHNARWRLMASTGGIRPLPVDLASNALDRGEAVQQAGWRVGP